MPACGTIDLADRGGQRLLTVEAAQKEFEPSCVYVNTASIGLPPRRVVATWLAWAGTLPALDLLSEVGIAAIHRHDLGLANKLRARLGLPPGDSAIVTVSTNGGLEGLRAADIRASVRAGAVRLSFHLHNTEADVDAVARALGA